MPPSPLRWSLQPSRGGLSSLGLSSLGLSPLGAPAPASPLRWSFQPSRGGLSPLGLSSLGLSSLGLPYLSLRSVTAMTSLGSAFFSILT
ncbi:MAG: hypothetical protein LBG71_02050 [Clostridiales Family XIII bacterium]|nr:hypothetical protein [Clostridiales Family XIII bacterium]